MIFRKSAEALWCLPHPSQSSVWMLTCFSTNHLSSNSLNGEINIFCQMKKRGLWFLSFRCLDVDIMVSRQTQKKTLSLKKKKDTESQKDGKNPCASNIVLCIYFTKCQIILIHRVYDNWNHSFHFLYGNCLNVFFCLFFNSDKARRSHLVPF